MKSKKLTTSLIFVGLASATGVASAQVTLDFADFTSGAYYGKSNIEGGCTASQACFESNGFTIGTINDPAFGGASAHLHQKVTSPILDANGDETGLDDYGILHHNDSAGIYLRATDGSAFSFDSFFLDSKISTNNREKQSSGVAPYAATGANAFWEIIGFNTDINADLNTYNWGPSSLAAGATSGSAPTNLGAYGSYVTGAYKAVDNGFVGDVILGDAFKNVNAVWIHYGNHPNTSGVVGGDYSKFEMYVDNFKITPAPVPVPAAVYLFGTGLMGFLALGKRRRAI